MKTRLARTIGALAVLLSPVLASAEFFTVTPVVTTSTPVPGGTGNFRAFSAQLGTDPIAPWVDGTSMVFTGIDANNRGGVYRWDNGVISLVANFSTPIPGQSGNFTYVAGGSISGQQVAFYGGGPSSYGVYLADGGQIKRIADTSMSEPGSTAIFDGFARVTIAGAQAAFAANVRVGTSLYPGVYRYRNGILSKVPVSFQPYGNVSSSRGDLVLFGSNTNSGLYFADAADHISTVVDTSTPIPGGGGNFLGFHAIYLSTDGPDVLFYGGNPTKLGLFERINGSLRAVVVNGQFAATNENFFFDAYEPEISLDQGHVAFLGVTRFTNGVTRASIYTDYHDKLERVIGNGDVLSGKVIERIELSPDALSGSLLMFNARFTDGSTGIYMTRVPEPASLMVLLPLVLLIRRGKRCHRLNCRPLVAPISTASNPF